jgi:ABC-type uncharacterized transport system auxiliary subunit
VSTNLIRTTWRVAALIVCLVPAACGILESGKPARQVYLLQTPAAVSHAEPAENAPVLIISVKAVPGLDTDRIMVLGNDAHLLPVANAHWPDHMPEVFTSITRRYLSNTGRFQAVREGSIARPDEWLLELELQAFYGIQNSADETSAVELQMEGLLRCGNSQKVLHVAQKASVHDGGLAVLVAAHQQVVDAAMQALSEKLNGACEPSTIN